MKRLDALTRKELRALCRQLLELLGEDAVARLVPDAPFERTDAAPQLALTAADPQATLRDLHDWFATVLGVVRAQSAGFDAIGDALTPDALAHAMHVRLERIAADAARALAFDPAAGLALAGRIVRVVRRAHEASAEFVDGRPWGWAPASAVDGLRPLLDALPAAAPGAPFDEEAIATWVGLAADMARVAPGIDGWEWLGAALDRAPDARVATALRWSESRAWDEQHIPLLLTLAHRTSPATIEPFLRAVDMHSTRSSEIVDLVIETLRRVGRSDEALFWEGERARRFGA